MIATTWFLQASLTREPSMEVPKSGGEIDDEPIEEPDPIEAVWQQLTLDNLI